MESGGIGSRESRWAAAQALPSAMRDPGAVGNVFTSLARSVRRRTDAPPGNLMPWFRRLRIGPNGLWVSALAALVLPFGAIAQEAIEPWQEYDKKIRAAEHVGALTHGLFGDQVSVYDQRTSFRHVDIDLPGTNALQVALARKLVVRPIPAIGIPPKGYAGAGDWDIDVPYISGVFDSAYGWNVGYGGLTNRCSSNFSPQTLPPSRIEDIWSGYTVNVPGGGARSLIGFPASPFIKPDGATRRWTTSAMDTVSCTPMVSGDSYPGEGFILETAEGLKYFFNVGTSRTAGTILSADKSRPRVEIFLLASRVEDRFGNWVAYTYNGNGHPTAIQGGDGRRIDLTYSVDRLVSATAHGRTWSYGYSGTTLQNVTRPDASTWRFTHGTDMRVAYETWTEDPGAGCGVLPPLTLKEYQLAIQHPSGATGTFHFGHKRNFRTGIPVSFCQAESGSDNTVVHYLDTPFHFDTLSLVSKTITGPGIPAPLLWSYVDTGGDPVGLWSGTVPPCLSCTASKSVTILQPDGSAVVESYGIVYALNEGKLLARQVTDSSGVLSSETLSYVSDAEAASQPFPDRYGALWGGTDESAVKIRPMKSRLIVQQGVSFQWTASQFDTRGRPTHITRGSTLPGSPTRSESTTYSDDETLWVLGQVSSVTCAASIPASSACNGGASSVMSQTSYDPTWALPLVSRSFGRIVQTLGYDTTSTVASGQRGTVKTLTDGNGKVTTATSWKRGIPTHIRYPGTPEAAAGSTQMAVVNDAGWIMSVTDENGFTTGYNYDAMGRLTLIDYPDGDTVDWHDTTLTFEPVPGIEYGLPAGHWRQTVSTGTARRTSYFDALWRPVVVREYDAANETATKRFSRFTYDYEGRPTFASFPGASDALTTGTWTYYDALGRPEQVTQDSELGPLTTLTAYLTGFKTQVTPPKGAAHRTTTSYLAWDQPTTDFPTTITHPAGAFTDIARDAFGKPTAITRRNSSSSVALTRSYVYNPAQLLCKSVEPETGATIMDYDAAGNLLWSKSGATQAGTTTCNATDIPVAQRTARTYDGRNRLGTLTFPDGLGNQSWTYTKDGLAASITTNNSNGGNVVTNTYAYNKRRLLENETFGVNSQLWGLGYSYTPNGHPASHVSPGNVVVDYAPNALGQPTKAGDYAAAVGYFPNGGMRQFTYGNGIKHTLTQNVRGLPDTSCDFTGGICGIGAVLNDGYDYDPHGNVMAISDGRTGHRGDRTMGYDALDRLTATTSPMFGTANYTYDVLDNLKTVKVTAGPKIRDHTYVYDANNRLTNITNTAGGATVIGLGYDVQGNLANRNGVLHDFDHGNRLRQASGEQYRYDGYGRRVLSTRGGRHIYSAYGQDGALRFQRDEHTGKTIDYVHLNGSLVAQVENAIALSTPVLTAPASSTNGSYTVSWSPVAIASKYQLQERLGSGSWSTIHDAASTSKVLSGKAAGAWGYQVRACSTSTCGSWGAVKTVTVQLPPTGIPNVTVPASSTTGDYAFSWTAVAAATRYEVQESVNGGTYSTLDGDVTGTTFTVTGRQNGSWSYRVRACNPVGCAGYSTPKAAQVTLPPSTVPTLTVPGGVNGTGSYTVEWTSVSTATRYELEERLGSAGSWSQIHDAATTSKAVSGKATGSWEYRARGCNGTSCGAWSVVKAVVVTRSPTGVPTLSAPSTSSSGGYTVSWTAITAATRYEVEERLGSGGWTNVHNAASTSNSVSGKVTGSWDYRVRACNDGGCAGYSTIATVVVTRPPTGVPTLTMPTSAYNGIYTASWTSVATATTYELQERLGTGSWSSIQNTSDLSRAVAGKGTGDWSYQVRACNAGGCAGWSAIRMVAVLNQPASAPTLTLPSNDLTGAYTASWTAVATATRFELVERLGVGAWEQIHNTAATSKALSGKTTGSWSYQVRACNDAGCSAYSPIETVAVTRPPTPAPTLTVPATNITGAYVVSWSEVMHAATYELQERLNSGSWSTLQSSPATSWALSGKTSGSWSYQVRACNASGCSGWTVGTVAVTTPPATPTIIYAHNHNTIQGSIVTPMCQIHWTSVPATDHYQMMASGGLFGLYSGTSTSIAGGSYCSANYIVRACNAAGCSPWSSPPRVPTYSEEVISPGDPMSMPARLEGEGE